MIFDPFYRGLGYTPDEYEDDDDFNQEEEYDDDFNQEEDDDDLLDRQDLKNDKQWKLRSKN